MKKKNWEDILIRRFGTTENACKYLYEKMNIESVSSKMASDNPNINVTENKTGLIMILMSDYVEDNDCPGLSHEEVEALKEFMRMMGRNIK